MKQSPIYLDYNATAPLRPAAREAALSALKVPLNASSIHAFGQKGRSVIERARTALSTAINCPAAQITFNSGATEGNNTLLKHFEAAYPNDTIAISAVEHPSLHDVPLRNKALIPVDANGAIDLHALKELLQNQRCSLVSVMIANNETGAIQPIQAAAALAHNHGALFHCDATQGLGRLPIDMQAMGIDFLTLSAHKIGALQGVGALATGLCGQTPTLLYGGGQEKKLRAGTENVAGITAFGAAVGEACNPAYLNAEHTRLTALQTQLEEGLKAISPDIHIHSQNAAQRLPNTTSFALPGGTAHSLLMNLDLEGFALSNGSACSSGTVKGSHVLRAMNVPAPLAEATLRLSTGWQTQEADITAFLKAWSVLTKRLKR